MALICGDPVDPQVLTEFNNLNSAKASILEQIQDLRLEQAQIKKQMVELSVQAGVPSLMTAAIMCW